MIDRELFDNGHVVSSAAREFVAEILSLQDWVDCFLIDALAAYREKPAGERGRQAFVNLLFVHLYHLFEQQLARIAGYLRKNGSYNFRDARDLLQVVFETCNVDVTFLKSWREIHQLRLIANTVKHSDANDSRLLKKLRPELFDPPGGLAVFRDVRLSNPTIAALAGLHFYPSLQEYSYKARSVIEFWNEVSKAVSDGNRPKSLRTAVMEKRERILEVAAKHGASNVRVFGSVARGTAGPNSDVDFLVELAPGTSFSAEEHLTRELEELLERRVDLATQETLKPRIRDRALREAIPL
jgi:hypothetical protein